MGKKLLLGTTNQEKIIILQKVLESLPIILLTLRDLNIHLTIKEDGKSPEENAKKKAQAYFLALNIPTLTIDAGLFIEAFPEDKQPDIYVRRISKQQSDYVPDEVVLSYYQKELDKIGGESKGVFKVALVLIVSETKVFSHSYSLEAVFTSKKSDSSHKGAPLSSLMYDPVSKKYFSEMLHVERPDATWIYDFVKQHLEEL